MRRFESVNQVIALSEGLLRSHMLQSGGPDYDQDDRWLLIRELRNRGLDKPKAEAKPVTQDTIIQELCRRTLRLNGKADFKQVVRELVHATHHLNKHFKASPVQTDYKPENHPIIQLLTMKLTNIACPKRDVSYYQCEKIVQDLANLEG